MPRVAYVGVGDKARKVKKMYIGVGDKARKVVKAYVGINNIAHIFYTADWWIPYGLTEENCIAAWQFYHAANQSTANRDITKNGHNVYSYGSPESTWTAANGYLVNHWLYSNLMNSGTSPVTGVFWYTSLPNASDDTYTSGRWFHAEGNAADMAGRIGKINRFYNGEWITETGLMNYPGFCMSHSNGIFSGYRGNSPLPSSGVVAFDRSKPRIYVNGNDIGITLFSFNAETINNMPIGTQNNYATIGGGSNPGMYIRAASFFNCGLTDKQHSEIAKMITEIK